MTKLKKMKPVLTLAGVLLAGAAWAGNVAPGDMGMGSFNDNSIPGMMGMGSVGATPIPGDMGMSNSGGGFTLPINPGSIADNYNGMPGTSPSGGGMPMLDLRQVVQQGIQGLPQQQRYSGATSIANQNLAQLNQSMGNGQSPISQIRNSVRDSIMTNRVNEISRLGQATFRPMIQPGAVQSMISQIQPWNFPYRFQSAMMPAMIPMVSAPIKQRQMAYMQAGIMNNPNFPNVPLPMPIYGGGTPYPDYGSGMPGNQGMYYPNGMMMPGNQGMYYQNGMMPGNQGMMYYNMQNMMMPNMMMPYGYY